MFYGDLNGRCAAPDFALIGLSDPEPGRRPLLAAVVILAQEAPQAGAQWRIKAPGPLIRPSGEIWETR